MIGGCEGRNWKGLWRNTFIWRSRFKKGQSELAFVLYNHTVKVHLVLAHITSMLQVLCLACEEVENPKVYFDLFFNHFLRFYFESKTNILWFDIYRVAILFQICILLLSFLKVNAKVRCQFQIYICICIWICIWFIHTCIHSIQGFSAAFGC